MEFNPKLQKLQMGSHFVVLKGKKEFMKAKFVIYDDFKRLFNEVTLFPLLLFLSFILVGFMRILLFSS